MTTRKDKIARKKMADFLKEVRKHNRDVTFSIMTDYGPSFLKVSVKMVKGKWIVKYKNK